MMIGQPLYDEKAQVLLKKGTRLSGYMINRLIALDHSYVYVYDGVDDYELTDVIRPELRMKAVNNLRRLASRLSEEQDFPTGRKPSLQTQEEMNLLKAATAEIVDHIFSEKNVVVEMLDIKHVNSLLFQHSVNTMIHSAILGTAAGLKREELEKLAYGALLHDIGHLQTPDSILKKKGKLTEEEMVIARTHTIKGFAFLTTEFDIQPTIKIVALEHHEKVDGTGYPHGKSGENLHRYSKITAIANRFDSLSSERPYRKPESLSECLEYIMGAGGSHFDADLTKIYMKHINPYPINTLVKLSDGSRATVTEVNSSFFLRPVVKIVKGEKRGETVNLMENNTLVIINDLSVPG